MKIIIFLVLFQIVEMASFEKSPSSFEKGPSIGNYLVVTVQARLHVMRAKIVLHVSTVLSTWVSAAFAKQNKF